MFQQKKWSLFILFIVAGPLLSFAQQQHSNHGRKYRTGDRYRYRMTTNVVHNGKWQSTIVAVCELTVVADSGNIPYDEVRWISKKVFTKFDTTEHTAELQRTLPYRISLHENGKLDLPPINEAGMTGEITDFNTFFVAISPKLGIGQLHKAGDTFKKPDNLQGNFANGKDILKGMDCLAVTTTLLQADKNQVTIQTDFLPPSGKCLDYLTPDMQQPVEGDIINNFQMVRTSSSGDYVNLFFGKELFLINSKLNVTDGKLAAATMSNTLNLKLKFNCAENYGNCQTTMPFMIQRDIKLELLP